MKYLGFTRATLAACGKRVAEACFNERSGLATSAACVVAGGVRETLSAHFGRAVQLHLLEPIVPQPDAWREIERGAIIFGVRGRIADAAVVLRARDAVQLAAAAFGERAEVERPLSPIEQTVLERTVRAIAGNMVSVCGQRSDDGAPAILHDVRGFLTYFELSLVEPVECCIGIALSRDPVAESRDAIRIEDLFDLRLELAARVELPAITTATLLDLRPGDTLPMTSTARPLVGRLTLGGRAIGDGECGVSANRFAIALSA